MISLSAFYPKSQFTPILDTVRLMSKKWIKGKKMTLTPNLNPTFSDLDDGCSMFNLLNFNYI